jgi:GT2 family glycosyltransferase
MYLVEALDKNPTVGIATCKFMSIDKKHLDSTGDIYTTWGLPFPRGRGEPVSDKYDKDVYIFGASGGASLYRADMLCEIGLFDEKFFAYYEDIDISFRAHLAGWKVLFAPKAVAYHQIGATSSRIKGFTTYQTMKNVPMLFWKNVPWKFIPCILPRLFFAYWTMVAKAIVTGRGWPAIKGQLVFIKNYPRIFHERRRIQKHKQVTDDYIASILTWDLPPNAQNLRNLRAKWWKLRRRI